MGEAKIIVDVKIQRNHSKKLIILLQESYINKVLEQFNILNCKPIGTLITTGNFSNLSMCLKIEKQKPQMSKISYANDVGALMYAMICTRLNIVYIVGLVSRFQSNMSMAH